MFIRDESMHSIDVPADHVVRLYRSMREIQLALPGVSAQQASAYLCQYKQPDGIATVAAFHLHKSGILAYYFSDPRVVSAQEMDDMLDQGLNFVESMGFILTDQDIHFMDQADLQKLWQSLPLNAGLSEEEPSPGAVQTKSSGTVAAEKPAASVTGRSSIAAKQQTVVETTTSSEADTKQSSDSAPGPETEPETAEANAITENVDDLLAVVEAMRAKSTSLRARISVPSAEEMKLRKEQLRETVGRILATL